MNIRIFILSCLLAGLGCNPAAQRPAGHTIVPQPDVFIPGKNYLALKAPYTINIQAAGLDPALQLLHEMAPLGEWQQVTGKALLTLSITDTLAEEAYTVHITDSVRIEGGSYTAVVWGIVSTLQMLEYNTSGYRLPQCEITDQPDMAYRAFMLDLAREWHELPTIRQLIDLCAWYKIRYMQLHLSDNESFTFPSKTFPRLATPGRHYNIADLEELVNYAGTRGVILIPELDGPGHTAAMRRAMPELFGNEELGIVNIADERTLNAMETLIAEMMEVFHTAPYFHIGADEVWLKPFSEQAVAQRKVKELGLEDVHDLYLQYIVRMHQFVRSKGKQTLVWESFAGDGSAKVKIPKDLLVIAWETLYQRPDSLVKNGYNIINASWKPAYVTPGRRWSMEAIYNWNVWRWENFWEITPAYKAPIQLDTAAPVLGAQMCAWEMTEAMELPLVRRRLPALAENAWAPHASKNLPAFLQRMQKVDSLFGQLTFPVIDRSSGFIADSAHSDHDKQCFSDTAFISMQPLYPGYQLRYTENGTVPDTGSALLPDQLILTGTKEIRFGLFRNHQLAGYKITRYELCPLKIDITGNDPVNEDVDRRSPEITFSDSMCISITAVKKGGTVRYTTNGKNVTLTDALYLEKLGTDTSMYLKAQFFDAAGKPAGSQREFRFRKQLVSKE